MQRLCSAVQVWGVTNVNIWRVVVVLVTKVA